MVAILAWPGAVAIGLSLGLLGSGGSILTVPVLVYLVGLDEKVAIASSLAIVGLIAFFGSLPYVRQRLVDWRSVALFGIPGVFGTYAGAWSSAFVSGAFQLAVFAVVMLSAAVFMVRRSEPPAREGGHRALWRITADGLVVGAVTGFVGVGGGFLVVPALAVLGGLSMHRAIATSLVIIAMKSAVGFIKYVDVLDAANLSIDANVIVLVSLLGIAGSLAGTQVARRVSTRKLQRLFAGFLIVMGVYILSTSMLKLLS